MFTSSKVLTFGGMMATAVDVGVAVACRSINFSRLTRGSLTISTSRVPSGYLSHLKVLGGYFPCSLFGLGVAVED